MGLNYSPPALETDLVLSYYLSMFSIEEDMFSQNLSDYDNRLEIDLLVPKKFQIIELSQPYLASKNV